MDPRLPALAEAAHLLVVSDFDGTLAGIVPDPSAVPVNRRALGALARLAGLPATTVAVLSGRGLEDLRTVCALREPVVLAGSHGAESGRHGLRRTEGMAVALEAVAAELAPLTRADGSVYLERKPFQVVFHAAPLSARDPAAAEAVLARASVVDAHGTEVSGGKNIVEFSAARVTKGSWIAAERERVGADRVLFLGDDVTDEDGFAALTDDDLGVKVGPGDSAAALRVPDRAAAAEMLVRLASARATHTGIPEQPAAQFRAVAAGFSAVMVQVTDWSARVPGEQWRARDAVARLVDRSARRLAAAGVDLGLRADARRDPAGAWSELVSAVQAVLADPRHARAVIADGPDRGATVAEATAAHVLPEVLNRTRGLARSQGLEAQLGPDVRGRTD